jgi:hypothetical protein
LNYQLFGVKDFTEEQNTEFIEKLYEIIDQHKSNTSINKSFGILLARMDRRNLTPKVSEQEDNKLLIEFSPKELSEELREQSEQAQAKFKETFKYSLLRTWSDFLIGKYSSNNDQNHKKYDVNPLLALSETKELIEELPSEENVMSMMNYSIPAFSCSKLMIEHKDKLSKEDKEFCRDIIISSFARLFNDDYDYQLSDGVEASVHAIPTLIDQYPDNVEEYASLLVLALLDKTSIGQYKRICDYVIESIHESNLWEKNQQIAQSILFGYIKLKPFYNEIIAEERKKKGYWGKDF